ncbi:type II toxin-antitoxin system PemK/MazF family toxin [Methylohalobius crimeensis]|uniref:type II toxin-antitoxin system PemK/MazF family toxin n=1 Tax=Methylohalobius crimeensis TaxID=244365 RepID=UPI0003B674B3|nr:type II toxin-antitoxin system PemK/MazF family toxin [Methylohalobius crimeensis]
MIYDRFTVVKVPFPFTDRGSHKKRPALVLSSAEAFNTRIGHSVMTMITSAYHTPWPLDCPIRDIQSAGLPAPSKVRYKLFTLDHRLILEVLGRLSERDVQAVENALNRLFS